MKDMKDMKDICVDLQLKNNNVHTKGQTDFSHILDAATAGSLRNGTFLVGSRGQDNPHTRRLVILRLDCSFLHSPIDFGNHGIECRLDIGGFQGGCFHEHQSVGVYNNDGRQLITSQSSNQVPPHYWIHCTVLYCTVPPLQFHF